MEEEMEGILVQAQEKFISPLLSFRKEQIGSVKATKKAFEKATTKLCTAQVNRIACTDCIYGALKRALGVSIF